MINILITGGAGFIGYNISKILSENSSNYITIIDNLSKGNMDEYMKKLIEKPNVNFINLDLTQQNNLDKLEWNFQQIYHLAAIVGVKKVMDDPVLTLKVNILSILYLLEKIKNNKNLKILFTSSCENYAGTINQFRVDIPTNENVALCIEDITNPRWSYASSKIVGEIACYQYAKKFNFNTTIVRYHNIYGPRMGFNHVIPEFLLRLKENSEEFQLYGGTQKRSFCYVTDAAKMTIDLMDEQRANGKIVNIGNDVDVIKINSLAKMMCQYLKINPKFIERGAPKGSVNNRIPDLTLIKSLNCYSYNMPFKKGLKSTIDWYREL